MTLQSRNACDKGRILYAILAEALSSQLGRIFQSLLDKLPTGLSSPGFLALGRVGVTGDKSPAWLVWPWPELRTHGNTRIWPLMAFDADRVFRGQPVNNMLDFAN